MKHKIISGEELFDLIRSLTKAEKRNFKILTKKESGEKFYIILFNIINGQKEYDEQVVLKKIKQQKTKKNYSLAKKYLFEKIIASLHRLGTYKYAATKVQDLIDTATLLRSKGLYNQAQRYLELADTEAIEADTVFYRFSINFWSYAFSLNATDSKMAIEEKAKSLNASGKLLLEKAEEYLKVYHIFRLVRSMQITNPFCRSNEEQKKLSDIISPLLAMNHANFSSVGSTIHYHLTLCAYNSMMGMHSDSLIHCKELIRLVKANPKIDNSVYPQLSNYITEAIKARHYEGMEDYLSEFLEGIKVIPDFHEQKLIFERWLLYSMKYRSQKGEFNAVISLYEVESARILKYKPLTKYIYFQIKYHLSVACFFSGNYSEAWKHIMSILNEQNPKQDMYVYAKIFSLIILYEREEYDLLQHALRSAYRMLLKKERLYKAEKNILDFIRNSEKNVSKKDRLENFRLLAQHLEQSFEDPFERGIQYYFDILRWLKIKAAE